MSDTQQTNPSPPIGDVQPVPVHVVADSTKGGQPAPVKRRRYKTHYETFLLTANNPTEIILPQDENRVIAWVQALDFDVVIGQAQGVVAAALNTAQSPATPNVPNGTLIPASNGAPYPVQDNGQVFAGMTNTAANARVAVSATYWVD